MKIFIATLTIEDESLTVGAFTTLGKAKAAAERAAREEASIEVKIKWTKGKRNYLWESEDVDMAIEPRKLDAYFFGRVTADRRKGKT